MQIMAWFSRLSVGAKLFAAFSTLLVLMGIMGCVAIWKMSDLNKNCNELAVNWMPATNAANQLNTRIMEYRTKEYRHVTAELAEEMVKTEQEMTAIAAEIDKQKAEVVRLCATPEEKQIVDELQRSYQDYIAESTRVLALSRENKKKEASALILNKSAQLLRRMQELLEKEVVLNINNGQTEVEKALAAYSMGRMITLIVLGVNVVLGLGLAIWIARWFTKAIVEVDDISNSVAAASQQLAAASEQLSSGAQQSASSLEETASSLEEITATVRQNADNADQANQLANSSRETAEKGGAVVANAVKAMGEINQASRKIADIITTIDEIAFQTNLLALNAAVEAARAGEQGRGFAVVAGEVRNLAQRSATAAREIKGLIQDSVNKVESGSELVNKSGETLGEIVSSVKRVTDIVAEIAAASREQTAGIEQINKAVAQMDQVTQSNASQTEEMSGTAVALSGQAEQLQTVVAQFNIKKQEVKASGTRTTARAAAPVSQPARSKPQSRKSTSRPQSAKPTREMELVGAGAGHDGFEEF
jgi:methyl-accepting chemotaxis protein